MSADVRFDEVASRLSTSQTSDGGVLQSILRAATSAGLDPVAELYNEALGLADEGHLGQARGRLEVLLGLAPSDGEAHLLLARILVAGGQWRRAVAALDEATQCGVRVPSRLRDACTSNLQADQDEEDDREVREVRELAEITRLRSEARRVRSENAHLAGQNRALVREAARWAWVATGTSVIAIFFVVLQMWTGGGATAADPEVAAIEGAATEAPVVEAAAAPEAAASGAVQVRDPGMKAVVETALASAGYDGLSVTVRGTRASLSGTVASHQAHGNAVQLVEALDGIESVDDAAVVNIARRDGTTHVVAPGESLSVIAYRMYGNQTLSETIIQANPALGGKANLQIGQKLTIPPVRD